MERAKQQGELPEHVAIIMDGNGRWSEREGVPLADGHREGIHSARAVADLCGELEEISLLSLFAFSTENWGRPASEIETLMKLLKEFLDEELPRMQEQGIRFEVIGTLDPFPDDVCEKVNRCRNATRDNRSFQLNLALNYGGRCDVTRAVRSIARRIREGTLDPEDIDEDVLSRSLDTAGLPDPDLLIRTSGERRLSNFMLWQLAYTEIVFSEVLWPDFREEEFLAAVEDYQHRDRRFGKRPRAKVSR